MNTHSKDWLNQHLPIQLFDVAMLINDEDKVKVAWNYQNVLNAMQWLVENDYALIGGEVYGKEADVFYPIGESWSFSIKGLEWQSYREESQRTAISFIRACHFAYNGTYYYAVSFVDQHEFNKRRALPKALPEDLYQSSIYLDYLDLGYEVVWEYEDVFNAINWYTENDYAISGGDVYERDKDRIIFNYDTWYSDKNALTWTEWIEASKQKALDYIEMYHRRNSGTYYYAIVASERRNHLS